MSATCVDTSSNFFFDSLSFFRHCMTYSMTLGTLFSGRICHFEDIFLHIRQTLFLFVIFAFA